MPATVDPASGGRKRLASGWAAGVVALLAWLPFHAVRNYGEVHDDHVLRGPGSLVADERAGLSELLVSDFFGTFEQRHGQTGYWRPLILLSFRVERVLAGASSAGYAWLGHVGTLLMHLGAALALLSLARRLGLGEGGAVLAAGLFAIHPSHAESVAWISGRTDVAANALGLLGLAMSLGRSRSLREDLGGAVLLTLALLCKETAVMYPLLWIPLARCRGRSWAGSLGPAIFALAAVATGRAFALGGLLVDSEAASTALPASLARWWTWASIVPDLLGLLVWPGAATPLRPVWEAASAGAPGVATGLALIATVLWVFAVALRRRSALGVLATGLVALTLLVLAPWVPIPTGYPEVAAPLFERHVYGAVAGPALVLGWFARGAPLGRIALLLVPVLLAVGPVTAARTEPWSSDTAYARAGLAVAPDSPSLWLHLGTARLDAATSGAGASVAAEAVGALDRALVLDPGQRLAALNRFIALVLCGDLERARRSAQELLERWPDDVGVLHNVAAFAAQAGDLDVAVTLYRRELASGRPLPGAREALAECEAALAAVRTPPGRSAESPDRAEGPGRER